MAGASNASSAGSPYANGHGEKRKADDSGYPNQSPVDRLGPTHTRSKRNRYISIACNECKRRKIKCNGQAPCNRCGNLNLECVYAPNCCQSAVKDSEEFQHMRDDIATLQAQVSELYNSLNDLQNLRQQSTYPIAPLGNDPAYPNDYERSGSMSGHRTLPPLQSPPLERQSQKAMPSFHGHTSSMYGFDLAKSTLQTMGITGGIADDGGVSRERSANASPQPATAHPNKDPLWLIDRNEALRLCRLYEDEIHLMYAHTNIDKIYKHVDMLYNFITAALRTGFGQINLPGPDAFDDEQTTMLKLILAVALMLENNGKSELADRFFQSTRAAVNLKVVDSLDLNSVHVMILTATYYFHKDEEAQAWRFIGIAARLCIEMGLHRKDSLLKTFTNEAEYLQAIRTFWVVYALDRRWSFGTGMPFAIQDDDIDPYLPGPDDSVPYLKHITTYNKLAAKVWYNNVAFEAGVTHKTEEIGFLDYQILQWYQQLPENMKFDSSNLAQEMKVPRKGMRRLRFIMLLRKNQARISVFRPIMNSATTILENRKYAQAAVDTAKDTIRAITGINQVSDMYRTQQVCYNYFLVQALAVVFLAVSHAPAEFCNQTRAEFDAAIDLIKTFNTKSHIARRLWKTIKGLKEMGDKIGLLARSDALGKVTTEEEDAHSSAAVAMAGLAGHNIEGLGGFPGLPSTNDGLGYSPEDAVQLGNELSHLFDLAGTYGSSNGNVVMRDGLPDPENFPGYTPAARDGEVGEGVGSVFGNEAEFSKLLGELF